MTQEEADTWAARKKNTEGSAEAERRKADLERIRKEEEEKKVRKVQQKAGVGTTLPVVEKTVGERRQGEARGLMPKMRARLEMEAREGCGREDSEDAGCGKIPTPEKIERSHEALI
jgi:hypothetical protein